MSVSEELIPPPPILRERIAKHVREGRMLRSLLRLSVRAAEEQSRQSESPKSESKHPGGVRA
jgi:hypothetical protein